MENFSENVYHLISKIPEGKVTTYREIGKVLGIKAYRAIGAALKRNPCPEVPCHRVVKSNGEVGGFVRGEEEKIKLLESEGVKVRDGKISDFDEKFMHLS